MRESAIAIRVLGVGAATLLLAGASWTHAQGPGTLRGLVVDTTGAAVRDADVGIASLRRLARTDDSGRFVFSRLPVGLVEVTVRRMSYLPAKAKADVGAAGNDSLRIVMSLNVAMLETMNVTAGEMRRREQIEDFHRRRIRGIGNYITRDEIDARASGTPSDMLRNTPGIRFVKVPSGRGVRFPTTSLSRRDCAPMIWIDGQRAAGLEIDDITLTDIEGIEIYNGPSTTPFQFSQVTGSATCGTIVVWSRPPTPRKRP